jgi:hypothetical protein
VRGLTEGHGWWFQSMAGSTSMHKMRLKYDVFLNHRGPDTKEQFLVPLIEKLHEANFEAFMDRRGVHHGENVFETIDEALASARMHVAFFSRNYAQSTYCLSELHQMLVTGRPIITVFCDVLSEHVRRPRNPRGPYAEAFEIHAARENPDIVASWVVALEKAAAIRGFVRANFR